jgi:hypothetical protein
MGASETNIPSAYVSEIVKRAYNFMVAARNGTIIDKTNDQNPNRIIEREIYVPNNRQT